MQTIFVCERFAKYNKDSFLYSRPNTFLNDDAMNVNAKTYNIEFSALSFPYFKIPPTYTSKYMGSCGMQKEARTSPYSAIQIHN